MTTATAINRIGGCSAAIGFSRVKAINVIQPPGLPAVTSVGASPLTIVVAVSTTIHVSGDAASASKWVITGGGSAVTVTSLLVAGSTITLTTTSQTNGASYTLNIPTGITSLGADNPLGGPYAFGFVGAGSTQSISTVQWVDEHTLTVIFSSPALEADATDASKYSVSNGVTVQSVTRLSPTTYRVKTSAMAPNTAYTMTSTVRDIYGN
jgi:hypothetical protein